MPTLETLIISSVADPVRSGPFWSDLDPDVWDRIRSRTRILVLINDTILTFLCMRKSY
jgi:hypothetical protein